MAKQTLIGTVDFETDPFKRMREPKAFAGDVFDGERHLTWWDLNCPEYAMQYMLQHPRIYYAHNGGKFDFHLLLPFIPRKRIKKLLAINGRIVQIVFDSKEQMELRDSFALIPRALREWAKEDIDITKLEKDVRETHRDEITRYLKKDTEYLHEMVTTFVETYGMHLTLASAAFKILHKQFGVPKKSIGERMDAKFRSYYFAGRVEFYRLGQLGSGFVCVDINSSFPYSMTKPHWEGDEYLSLITLPKRNLEQSFIRCICESRGAFPFRNEDGSVSFPSDGIEREFFVTGWEYVAASDLGLLYNCSIINCYTPTSIRDYKDYIEHFYAIKNRAELSNDKGERLFSKLLMNSGYGKFGIDPREFEEYALRDWRDKPDEEKDGEKWQILKDDEKYGITIYKRPAKNTLNKFNNVCVAASITGCSRALLLRAAKACKEVVYMDTDSLIARDVSGISIGSKLGQWKKEHEFSELHIAGKKLYAGRDAISGKWKTASKGAKLTAEQIIEVSKGNTVEYEFDAPSYSIRNIKSESDGGKPGATNWLRFTKRKIRRADKMVKK